MKNKCLIFILFLLSLNIYSQEPFVQIYKTHDNGLYGRSEDRDMLLSINSSVFKRFETIEADNEYNFITGVVIAEETINTLESALESTDTLQIGFVKISRKDDIITIEDDNLFLKFSFSYIRPNEEVINIIKEHYKNLPQIQNSVVDHYNKNYIIRIHSAENILNPEAEEITYDEALIMATIIGDNDQWLWGIHNGSGYLKLLLQ